MAYLSPEQITGEIILNAYVDDNKKIINNANNSSTIITSMIGSKSDTVGGISSFSGKFHSHGLLPNIYIYRINQYIIKFYLNLLILHGCIYIVEN